MALYLIGLGLGDEKDITVKGLEAVKNCSAIYLESYTSLFGSTVDALKKFYGKEIIIANRELVETKAEETILKDAKTKNTAFLVIGDPLTATTHIDLMMRAKKLGIEVKVIHNTSIMNAIAETGLQLYKFGPTASIPFCDEKFMPETPYNILKENFNRGVHTLMLLDLKPAENKFMTVQEGLNILLKIEKKRKENVISSETKAIGCARLGREDAIIKFGTVKELLEQDFGKPLHCVIFPGKMHFVEEEALNEYSC